MAINRVDFGGNTLIDLAPTTATAQTVLRDYGFFGRNGEWVDGEAMFIRDYIYNVREEYEAVGDGNTDDTAAVQNAINAALVTGGVVFFPEGEYRITSTLNVPTGDTKIAIVGQSSATSVIKNAFNGYTFNVTNASATFEFAYHFEISNLGLTCYTKNSGGVYMEKVAQGLLRNVDFIGVSTQSSGEESITPAIKLQNCSQLLMTDIQAEGFSDGLNIFGSGIYGDIYLSNARFDGNKANAIHIYNAEGFYGSNVSCYENKQGLAMEYVNNCFFSNCAFDSSHTFNGVLQNCQRLKFSNSWFSDNVTYQDGDGKDGLQVKYCNYIDFNGCTFCRSANHGVYAEGCNGILMSGCRVEDNDYLGTYQSAICFAYSTHCTVNNSQFSNPLNHQAIGIQMYEADYIVAIGNDLSSTVYPFSGDATHKSIDMNLTP